MRRALLLGALLLAGCEDATLPTLPRWLIARRDVDATDDRGVHLRRGFGIGTREQRAAASGVLVRSDEGHWFPLEAFEPAQPARRAAIATPRAPARPAAVASDEPWVDVDLASQRLLARRGDRVLRAMKISSGVGEEGAAYSTPKGEYRIYAKLRSATMASAPVPDGAPPDPHPYRFESVPDVQYFHREIALHGAYWHQRLGERVSHGCVNLAPDDAAWLFAFTAPELAAGERERATPPGKLGTLVRVR